MEDMGMTAQLFQTSSRLHSASSWLRKIAQGEDVDSQAQELLKWTGTFLREVDWSSSAQKGTAGGGLVLQATSIRPTFYSVLIRIAPELQAAGLKSEKQIGGFLTLLYDTLSAGGVIKGPRKLNAKHSEAAATLLHEISQSILVQMNNNGLPRAYSSLRDEWKASGNEYSNSAYSPA
jgi:hypothetical protein